LLTAFDDEPLTERRRSPVVDSRTDIVRTKSPHVEIRGELLGSFRPSTGIASIAPPSSLFVVDDDDRQQSSDSLSFVGVRASFDDGRYLGALVDAG